MCRWPRGFVYMNVYASGVKLRLRRVGRHLREDFLSNERRV
jgi:hypothetical protein